MPSVYYGSEFGIEGRKEAFSDASLRPALNYADYADAYETNSCTKLIAALGNARQHTPALSYGAYRELLLTNRQYAFARDYEGQSVLVSVNNDDQPAELYLAAGNCAGYHGVLSGAHVPVENGQIHVTLAANSGDIWLPDTDAAVENEPVTPVTFDAADAVGTVTEPETTQPAETSAETPTEEAVPAEQVPATQEEAPASDSDAFERGRIAGLQEAILAIMSKNGEITDQMRRDVEANVYHDSLINWIKSFR